MMKQRCKTLSARVLAVVLSLVMLLGSLPVSAAESRFLSFQVESVSENGSKTESREAAYVVGQELYVSTNFLAKYTLFYYNGDTHAFVRRGQEANSKFGRVEINPDSQKATVYMNPFSSKEYTLHGVYTFGQTTFLPLDQMAAYLKCSLTIKDDVMRVVNSGYSLVDAEYAMSKIQSKSDLLRYDVGNIVDDIFDGSEMLFKLSGILGYFGSTVFERRISKLDFIFHTGDIKEYESFLDKCVTDNQAYMDALTSGDDLINRFSTVAGLNKDVHDTSKKLADLTSIITDVTQPLKEDNLSASLLWKDASDWNTAFSDLSKITQFADYYLKLGSMCEDNQNMLAQFGDRQLKSDTDFPFRMALLKVKSRYGGSTVSNIMGQVGQQLIKYGADDAVKTALKKAASDAVLSELAIATTTMDVITKVCRAAGCDIASDANYSIMLDLAVRTMLFNDFNDLDNTLRHTNESQTENYRQAAIFYLIACKQTFDAANKLAAKYDMSATYYKNRIKTINTVLSLYYLAIQSKHFDNFAEMEENIANNQQEIRDAGLLQSGKTVSQDEALQIDASADDDLQKRQWNAQNGELDYSTDGHYIYTKFARQDENYKLYYSLILGDASGSEKVLAECTEGFVFVGDRVYYCNAGGLFSCNLDGGDQRKEMRFFYDYKNDYYYTHLIPLPNHQILCDTEIADGAGGTAQLLIYDTENSKSTKIGSLKMDGYCSFYTRGDDLYMSGYGYDGGRTDGTLFKYSLSTADMEVIDVDVFVKDFNGIFGDIAYFTDSERGGKINIYKLDLTKNEGFTSFSVYDDDESMHDILIYRDQVFITSGTGAGDGFAVWNGKEFDYKDPGISEHGLLSEYGGMEFLGSKLVGMTWNGIDNSDDKITQLYDLQ
jgi:hypothetical protein